MVVALRDVSVRGEIHTIIDYAVDMLTSPVRRRCLRCLHWLCKHPALLGQLSCSDLQMRSG